MTPTAAPPLYARIKDFVLRNIESGQWALNQQIPPESALVQRFKASRMTVHRALRELANDGRISRHPGKGSFVSDARPKSEFLVIRSISDEIAERGHKHSARVHVRATVKGRKELTDSFDLPEGSPLFHTVIVHSENAIPIQLEDRYVNPNLMPHYLEADFRKLTPNQVLAQVASVKEADHIVEAVLADARACKLLKIGRHEPCLRVYRAASIEGGVSSIAWLTYPGTRFRLSSKFQRGRADV
jgi:GntR family histidine utilization transcriptional repressor